MSTTPPPDIPGLTYVQPLGSGGYADVYLFEQQMPRMPVAVKVLKTEGISDGIKRQFAEEADTMAALADHPYIVQVFGAGTAPDGRPYLVMKYYPPPNMATRARAERFTVEETLRTGVQLASAVETAHRAGILHRDIKPANVLVSQYGAPGLTDFGIAGRGGAAEIEDDDVGVSVPWAPPEVIYGQSNGDERADVYSLAATLWQLLTGRSPFEIPGGDNSAYALMPRIRSNPVPSTGRPDVPVSLERLLAQAMAKEPANRPESALAFARALQAVEQEQRFPRTPVLVLDEEGNAAPDSTSYAGLDDGDRTRVRAPQAVRAQLPVQSRKPLSGGTVIPPAVTSEQVATAKRPVAVPQEPIPVRPGTSGQRYYERSYAAPPAAYPTSPPDEDAWEEPAPRTMSAGLLLGLVGALVLGLAVAVALLVRGGGEEDADGRGAPSTAVTQADVGPIDVPETPTLRVESRTAQVRFSWEYVGRGESDTFRVRQGATREAVEAASVQTLAEPTLAVPAAKGQQVCAQVQVSRDGLSSTYSQIVCGKAG
ncbi:MAG: serine/threonine protein kinase [Micrococcales bacterium]|nr:serine/threonine protein kinase [Micrococcales bacterium]